MLTKHLPCLTLTCSFTRSMWWLYWGWRKIRRRVQVSSLSAAAYKWCRCSECSPARHRYRYPHPDTHTAGDTTRCLQRASLPAGSCSFLRRGVELPARVHHLHKHSGVVLITWIIRIEVSDYFCATAVVEVTAGSGQQLLSGHWNGQQWSKRTGSSTEGSVTLEIGAFLCAFVCCYLLYFMWHGFTVIPVWTDAK